MKITSKRCLHFSISFANSDETRRQIGICGVHYLLYKTGCTHALQRWLRKEKRALLAMTIISQRRCCSSFTRARLCSKQGIRKSAFELLKLVLACNPDKDPCGALLDLDVYAIKADQPQFIKEACSAIQAHERLPNFALASRNYAKLVHSFPSFFKRDFYPARIRHEHRAYI